MIVPQYWAESKTKKIVNRRQFTIKRFGWSDTSEQEAKSHAEARLREAVAFLEANGEVRRIDHKVPYNGAEGIPIREEVIARYQDVVISRNTYGALCLNTPDVLFADIDHELEAPTAIRLFSFALLAGLSAVAALSMHSWIALVGFLFLTLVFSSSVAGIVHKILLALAGGAEKKSLQTITKVSTENPDLHIRLYRTPMGLRILLMNDAYDPGGDLSMNILKSFNSDRVYIQMCKNQNCFRARVSPKPWRVGVERLGPRPGVWPINPDRLADRAKWVSKYEKSSANYSSCHFLMKLGSNKVHEKAEFVRQIHDDLCKAHRNELGIA